MNDQPLAPIGRGSDDNDPLARVRAAQAAMEAMAAMNAQVAPPAAPPPGPARPPPEVRDGFERRRPSGSYLPPAEVRPSQPGASAPSPQGARLADAAHTATTTFNSNDYPERREDEFTGPRVGGTREGRPGQAEVQVEARTRTQQTVTRDGDRDVYRQTVEARTLQSGRLAPGSRVGLGREEEQTRSASVELRVPHGSRRDLLPTNHSALHDPLRMPDGGELRIRGGETKKSQSGVDLPIGPYGSAGVDGAVERGTASEVRVRREGNHAVVTRIDETRRTDINRVGGSVGVVPRVGGVRVGEARGGVERTELSRTERTARFDLSTLEGRAAYERFVQTREVPTAQSPGVDRIEERTVERREQGAVGTLELNTPVERHQAEGKVAGRYRSDERVRGADGTEARVRRSGTEGGLEAVATTRNGRTEYEVRIPNADSLTRQLLQRAFGARIDRNESGDLTLRFDAEQFERLRRQLNQDTLYRPSTDPLPPAGTSFDLLGGLTANELAMRLDRAARREGPIQGGRQAG